MLLEKYEPKSTGDIIGNGFQIREIKRWLLNWKKGSALIVSGPPGCGKNIALKLVAKELGHKPVCLSVEGIIDVFSASKEGGVFFDRKLIILEDTEFIRPKKILGDIVKNSAHPVAVIAKNSYDSTLSGIATVSKSVKFATPDKKSVLEFLLRVCRNEGISCDTEALRTIAQHSAGDIRGVLIDLELLAHGSDVCDRRETSHSVFEAAKSIFTGRNAETKKMLENYTNHGLLFLFLTENIHREYKNIDDVSHAYAYAAKADRFRSLVVKRQSWSLEKYFIDMLAYGLSKKIRISIATHSFPKRPKGIDSAVLKNVCHLLHVSKKDAASYMGIVKMFLHDDEFCAALGIDDVNKKLIKNY